MIFTTLLLLACGTSTVDPNPSGTAGAKTNPPNPPIASAPKAVPAPKAAPPKAEFTSNGRIVAIGDIHADPAALTAVLELTGLAKDGKWTGGDTTLVQTGDMTDRGPDSSAVIDALVALREQAKAAGGQVVMMNGNHEVMNLQHDWRYVNPAEIQKMGGKAKREGAYARDGKYGKILGALPVVVKVDETLFTHGGLHPTFAKMGIDEVNSKALSGYFSSPGQRGVNGQDGPYWYRGYVKEPESTACPRLEEALQAVGAKRMVVGHTTRKDGAIQSRCGGRLTVIDIGISEHYGGHLGAWESVKGDAKAVMPKGTVDLPDPS